MSHLSNLEIRFLECVSSQDFGKVVACIAKKVNPNCVTVDEGNTALHIAVETHCVPIAVKLLSLPKINIEIKNKHGLSPLMSSIDFKSFSILQLLLNKNANVNSTDYFGNTALHSAVRTRFISLVQLLLKHGAKPNAINSMINTPLHVAVLETRFWPMVKLLIEHGADVNINAGNMSLFLQAVFYCHSQKDISIVLYLLEQGADINSLEKISKRNALHFVAITGSTQLAFQLLKQGVNPKHKDTMGKTPKDIALEHRNYDMIFIFERSNVLSTLINCF